MINNQIQINAQEWLEQNIPSNQRRSLRELYIFPISVRENSYHLNVYDGIPNRFYIPSNNILVGELSLSEFICLEKIIVENQAISCLDLSTCSQIQEVYAGGNLLRRVLWPSEALRLKEVNVSNNNIVSRDLSEFSNFINLRSLLLGTYDTERIQQNIYNRWTGSLVHLQNLSNLQELDINATDISDGLEYLPLSELKLYHFTFGTLGRANAQVKELQNTLARDLRQSLPRLANFTEEEVDDWAALGTYFEGDSMDLSALKVGIVHYWQEQQRQQSQVQV